MMLTKTDRIKKMVSTDFPIPLIFQSSLYKDVSSPWLKFRDGVKKYSRVTASLDGVSFFDPELNVADIDEFIKTHVRADN